MRCSMTPRMLRRAQRLDRGAMAYGRYAARRSAWQRRARCRCLRAYWKPFAKMTSSPDSVTNTALTGPVWPELSVACR